VRYAHPSGKTVVESYIERAREKSMDSNSHGTIALGLGLGNALGAGTGVAIGAVTGDLPFWLGLGIGLGSGMGTAMGVVFSRDDGVGEPEETERFEST
jgi:hypothetical protein